MARQAGPGATTAGPMGVTVEFKVHFRKGERGRRRMRTGTAPKHKPVQPGRIPRISRLMALAIHSDKLIRQGAVQDYAELARLGGVTPSRISQVMDLLNLAPAIQESILYLRGDGRGQITERRLRRLVSIPDWDLQKNVWRDSLADVDKQSKSHPYHDCLVALG
jgi:hypothetical protein